MTDDMKSMFGIVDDGSTDKTIKKIQQFDKAISKSEGSVDSLTGSLSSMDKAAPKGGIGGGKGGGRPGGTGRAVGQLGSGLGGDIGNTVSQVGRLGEQAEILGGNSSKAAMAVGGAGIALAAISIGVKLFQNHLDKANNEFTRSLGVLEDLARVTAQGSDAAAARIEQARAEIEIQKQLKAEAEKTAKAESGGFKFDPFNIITDLEETAQKAAKAAGDVIKSEQELIDSLTDEFGPALQVNTAEVEKSASALQQLAEQESNLRATRKQALDDLAVDRARRDSRAAEDSAEADAKRSEQSAEAARKDIENTTRIRTAGAAQQAKLLTAANNEIIKTINDGHQVRDKLRQEFSDRAIKDQNRFNERRAQAENDFRNNQFDAVQDNDIIAALRAQRDFDEQEKQDQSAAAKETQQRDDEKRERLQQLRDEQRQRIAEVRANLVLEIAAQKEALQARLRDAANASVERQRQEAKADKETEKARSKRQRRQAEDDALADERSARAFREQLKAIDDKKKAEQQALAAVFATLQASGQATVQVVGQATTTVINSLGQVTQQFVNGLANAANSGRSIPAFAEGGIVTSPTLALIGEREPEGVFPLSKAGEMGFGGGQSITINLTTADIASVGEVIRIVQGAAGQMAQADIQVLANSLAGVTQ